MDYESRFAVGDFVRFVSPNSHKEWDVKSIVTAVKFTDNGKVRYDIDVIFDEGRAATRLHSVDSVCIDARKE